MRKLRHQEGTFAASHSCKPQDLLLLNPHPSCYESAPYTTAATHLEQHAHAIRLRVPKPVAPHM